MCTSAVVSQHSGFAYLRLEQLYFLSLEISVISESAPAAISSLTLIS